MTEQLITEIQRKMLPYLNNEQLMHLRDALAETLEGATITYDSGSIPAEETDAVEAFITAKRIEGCSEKTLSYYRKTIESLVAPMYEAMEANDVQSKALSQMRDTLLPKLMSGEIDVSDIQL